MTSQGRRSDTQVILLWLAVLSILATYLVIAAENAAKN